VLAKTQAKTDCFYQAPKVVVKKTNTVSYSKYGRWDCVRFVKDLLGIKGTWGDGARKLSRNSDGQVGDVAIFKGYVHAGLVVGHLGEQIIVREWITTKYRVFEQTRALSLNQFLGFHKF